MSEYIFRSKTDKAVCPVCCGKVLEGVQLRRDTALGEAGHIEIAPRSPFTALRLRQDWSWKLSNVYNISIYLEISYN